MRRLCVTSMERIVLTGYDTEMRKLGAMHVLTALTSVPTAVRSAVIWLYESIHNCIILSNLKFWIVLYHNPNTHQ